MTLKEHIATVVKGVGHYLPQNIVTNQDLSKIMDTSDEWIKERTGIRQRHVAADKESTSEMGYKASLEAIEDAGLEVSDIEIESMVRLDDLRLRLNDLMLILD